MFKWKLNVEFTLTKRPKRFQTIGSSSSIVCTDVEVYGVMKVNTVAWRYDSFKSEWKRGVFLEAYKLVPDWTRYVTVILS